MDQPLLAIFAIAVIAGLLASVAILRASRRPKESPFAAATEGSKRCPNCGLGNMSTDATCASCGTALPG
ncbi:MAG: hypothetical protein ABI555_01890 [Chloroflexota bacterium]